MEAKTAYVLNDGRIFLDPTKARREAEAAHANLLSKLSVRLVKETEGKYSKIPFFIMENRAKIEEMFAAFDDIALVSDEEQE